MVDFSHNQLRSAEPLASLKELVSVQLGNNALTELPDWQWEALEHLATLAAPANQISVAPAGLGSLQMLVSLDLCDNKIEQIPIEMGGLSPKKLQAVRLKGNPLADPRRVFAGRWPRYFILFPILARATRGAWRCTGIGASWDF